MKDKRGGWREKLRFSALTPMDLAYNAAAHAINLDCNKGLSPLWISTLLLLRQTEPPFSCCLLAIRMPCFLKCHLDQSNVRGLIAL